MRNSQCVARTAVTKLRVDHEHMDTALDLSYAITDVRMSDMSGIDSSAACVSARFLSR